ncbi:hypothetical protein SAMN05660405_02681 [Psychrobacter pacificensis]|uniref:Uncharacterized protein n=2 Tax=root TaxID=1 RepID=A0A1G7B1F4_9GAMM|nr:hypothetical protein [Psychrobacter pacificensis]GLR27787.1 hypothetical protein GCM10007915_00250 [Psychrobacter pacificensis]GLR28975.1 hypothetical protein GCM10007915_12130 [Psychrobacter pacificensis]SDE20841.1 hypothetical protein SAMN05660405_02681 [Psychrobacter pacificensis]
MDLNKLMQMAIEHQQQQEASKLQHNATFELLALTFIRTVPPVQREQELSLSMKEVIDNAGYLDDEQEEIFLELMGNAKNIVIDMAITMETSR